MSYTNEPVAVPMPEGQIRDQIHRATEEMIERVPLSQRAPTTPRVEGTVLCKDGMPNFRIMGYGSDSKATTRCEVVEMNTASLPAEVTGTKGVSVIGRATQALGAIPVQRIDLETGEVHSSTHQLKTAAQRQDPSAIVYAERPNASDGNLGVARPDYEVATAPAVRAGVIPTQKTLSPLSAGVETVSAAPPSAAPQMQQKAAAPVARQKVRVAVRSKQLGTMRLRVDYVGISTSCLVLGYVDDDDATVFEPPIGNAEDPLSVEVDGTAYECVYYGLSTPMRVDHQELLLVVLVRVS